jgi:hypothetical protein
MFKYQVLDYKHNSLIKECNNLAEAIDVSRPLLHKQKLKIKKMQNDKVVRELTFIIEEGKDTLLTYFDAGGLQISSPI